MQEKKEKRPKKQFTKIVFIILLINAILWVWAPYILAAINRIQIAENIAIAAITNLLGTFAILCVKSYKETKQEKIQDLENMRYMDERNFNPNANEDDDFIDPWDEVKDADAVAERNAALADEGLLGGVLSSISMGEMDGDV